MGCNFLTFSYFPPSLFFSPTSVFSWFPSTFNQPFSILLYLSSIFICNIYYFIPHIYLFQISRVCLIKKGKEKCTGTFPLSIQGSRTFVTITWSVPGYDSLILCAILCYLSLLFQEWSRAFFWCISTSL